MRGRARGGQGLAKRAVGGPVIDRKGLCARNGALSHACVHARLFRCSYDLCVLHVCCGVSVRSYLWVRERERERETERERDYQRSNSVRDRLKSMYFESNLVRVFRKQLRGAMRAIVCVALRLSRDARVRVLILPHSRSPSLPPFLLPLFIPPFLPFCIRPSLPPSLPPSPLLPLLSLSLSLSLFLSLSVCLPLSRPTGTCGQAAQARHCGSRSNPTLLHGFREHRRY